MFSKSHKKNSVREYKKIPTEEPPNKWLWLLIILLFASITRILYFLFFQSNDPFYSYLIHDAKNYHEWAASILKSEFWESGPFYQAPLYPYLLAFLYLLLAPAPMIGYLFQALLGVILIFLIYRVCTQAYSVRAGIFAAGFASLYGVFLFHETKLLPGTLSAFIAILAVERMQVAITSAKAYYWAILGIVVGLGCLTSPAFLLLVPLTIAWIVIQRTNNYADKVRCGIFFLFAVLLLIAPITIRNIWIGKDLVLISTNGGITFYQGNNPSSQGIFSSPEGFSGSIFKQRKESRMLAEQDMGYSLRDSEISRYWFQKGISFIRENPARYLWLLMRKVSLVLDNYEHALEYNPQLDGNPIRYLVPLPFAMILGFAMIRFFLRPKLKQTEIPLFLIILVQLAVLLIFYVSSRYRLPAMPALIALAGGGVTSLWDHLRMAPRRLLFPSFIVIAIILFSFFHMPFQAPSIYTIQTSMALCDHALAYSKMGQDEKAAELYRKAIQHDPEYPYAHLDLSKVLFTMGNLEAAEQEIRQTLVLAPKLAEAHYDLGVLLYKEGRLDDAANAFDEAFRLDPFNSNAGNNLLGTCLRLRRYTQAIEAWRMMKKRNLAVDPPLESWMMKNASKIKEF